MHHMINILLHGANGILLFLLFKKMTANLWPSLLLALLFVIHPLHVESVAWISERMLFIERERACDDVALGENVSASDYAGYLMEVLEEMGNQRNALWVTAAMAEGTDFKDRILSVLNPAAQRSSTRTGHVLAAVALSLLVVLPPYLAFRIPAAEQSLAKTNSEAVGLTAMIGCGGFIAFLTTCGAAAAFTKHDLLALLPALSIACSFVIGMMRLILGGGNKN